MSVSPEMLQSAEGIVSNENVNRTIQSTVGEVGNTARHTVSEVGSTARSTVGEVGNTARHTVSEVGRTGRSIVHNVADFGKHGVTNIYMGYKERQRRIIIISCCLIGCIAFIIIVSVIAKAVKKENFGKKRVVHPLEIKIKDAFKKLGRKKGSVKI